MASYPVRKSDKAIRAILGTCYPDWRGRKVFVRPAVQYQMSDYWDGGTRHYVVAYELVTGRRAEALGAAQVPMNDLAHATVGVPRGVVLVEHAIFCGKDAGVTIVVHPDNLTAGCLPSPASPSTALASGAEVGEP
jgi:hypothetical protein